MSSQSLFSHHQGSPRLTIQVTPLHGSRVTGWTPEHKPDHYASTYFISSVSIELWQQIDLCVHLAGAERKKSKVFVGVSSFDFIDSTNMLRNFVADLPAWCTPIDYISNYYAIEV
jgi:hypothetical protein